VPAAGSGQRHQNYIDDILGDNQGMNIHRLPMALWTVVFGGYSPACATRTGNPRF
jgi:hypothetical protein